MPSNCLMCMLYATFPLSTAVYLIHFLHVIHRCILHGWKRSSPHQSIIEIIIINKKERANAVVPALPVLRSLRLNWLSTGKKITCNADQYGLCSQSTRRAEYKRHSHDAVPIFAMQDVSRYQMHARDLEGERNAHLERDVVHYHSSDMPGTAKGDNLFRALSSKRRRELAQIVCGGTPIDIFRQTAALWRLPLLSTLPPPNDDLSSWYWNHNVW